MHIKKRTLLKLPNYKRLVEFGVIHKIAYKVHDSGNYIDMNRVNIYFKKK